MVLAWRGVGGASEGPGNDALGEDNGRAVGGCVGSAGGRLSVRIGGMGGRRPDHGSRSTVSSAMPWLPSPNDAIGSPPLPPAP